MTKIIKIIYEDENILAINKPSGILVHSDGKSQLNATEKNKEKTIVDWLIKYLEKKYPEIKNVGEQILRSPVFGKSDLSGTPGSPTYPKTTYPKMIRPGIVHRLDKETSGVLLIAKNQKAFNFLKKQFANSEIKKTYIAVISGHPKNDQGIIDKPIGRSPKDFRRRLSGRGSIGTLREAVTEYKIIKKFFSKSQLNATGIEPFSLVEIFPKTGRMHQIRVHMKFINYPIACDSLYNPNSPCPENFSRLGLHAKSIEFKNLGGKKIKIEAPAPKEFKNI
ncbi:MAG: RluA family pseudouridine synthase [Patescibacteria group bacterium]